MTGYLCISVGRYWFNMTHIKCNSYKYLRKIWGNEVERATAESRGPNVVQVPLIQNPSPTVCCRSALSSQSIRIDAVARQSSPPFGSQRVVLRLSSGERYAAQGTLDSMSRAVSPLITSALVMIRFLTFPHVRNVPDKKTVT